MAAWPLVLCANRNRNEKREKKSIRFVTLRKVFTIAESPEHFHCCCHQIGGASNTVPHEPKGVKPLHHRRAKQSCLGGILPPSPASLEVALASLPIHSQKSFRSCDESVAVPAG